MMNMEIIPNWHLASVHFTIGLLAVIGYKCGKVVYCYGTGVMRISKIHGNGGHESYEHGAMSEKQGHDHSGDAY